MFMDVLFHPIYITIYEYNRNTGTLCAYYTNSKVDLSIYRSAIISFKSLSHNNAKDMMVGDRVQCNKMLLTKKLVFFRVNGKIIKN